MKKIILGLLCISPLALPFVFNGSEDFPSWAYPVTPPPRPGPQAAKPKDDGKQFHVPESDVALTRTEIEGRDTVPDWHPNDHPTMPDIVKNGRPNVRACAYCHQPNGTGRPESASLAGLTEAYIKHQVENFKMAARKSSAPDRALQKQMIDIAMKVSDADLDSAAAYFVSLKLATFVKVVEADTVPKTFVTDGMLAKDPEGGTEPIGKRIIEVPEDLERAQLRDSHTTYVAYVPKGSLEKGKVLVTTGGGTTTACATCHGPDLHGAGDVPHIAGRSPSYIIRQLYDIKHNARTGSVTFMQQVVSGLDQDDMIAIAAYVASREP
jgi:cytochrome c553